MNALTAPPTSTDRIERWVSKRDCAAHFGVSVRTVERWMTDGCPSRLVGSVRRFQFTAVDCWLDEQAQARAEAA